MVGADGFIGKRLLELTGGEGTSRGNPIYHHHHVLDLKEFNSDTLPDADVVYICAGVNGAKNCEGNQEAHRTNVDGTIKLAKHYVGHGAFVVWVSSTTVEWANTSYARQKAMTETVLFNVPNVGIVRAGRVLHSNVDDLCNVLMKVGRDGIEGLTLWGTDEKPYDK